MCKKGHEAVIAIERSKPENSKPYYAKSYSMRQRRCFADKYQFSPHNFHGSNLTSPDIPLLSGSISVLAWLPGTIVDPILILGPTSM